MAAVTSVSDEKWRPFKCFFSRVGLRTYQHPVHSATLCVYVIICYAMRTEFYVLLTEHLGIILFNDQLDAQFFYVYVYVNSQHVSSNPVLIIRRINCINKTSGVCHSV